MFSIGAEVILYALQSGRGFSTVLGLFDHAESENSVAKFQVVPDMPKIADFVGRKIAKK